MIFLCKKDKSVLEITKGFYSSYYCCPKYYVKNRKSNEKGCCNRISLINAYDIRQRLCILDEIGELKEEDKFIYKNYYLQIERITNKVIRVLVSMEGKYADDI